MKILLRRREFIAGLGGAAAWPLAAGAQRAVPVIGFLAGASPEANAIRLRAFNEGLRATGYVEGRNVKLEYRWAEAHTGQLPELAAQLVHPGGRDCSGRGHRCGAGREVGDSKRSDRFPIRGRSSQSWTCGKP